MAIEVRIPVLGESVTEGTIARWLKADGDSVSIDEPLLELETDKANVEIPAERAGRLHILRNEGETVNVGDVVAEIDPSAAGAAAPAPAAPAATPPAAAAPSAAAAPPPAAAPPAPPAAAASAPLSPAVRRLVEENQLDPSALSGTGKGGRLTKEDVLQHLEQRSDKSDTSDRSDRSDTSERVPMTRIRQRIAERLVQAQHTAAILTTFNEIDMSAVLDLRQRHKERFAKVHGIGLGFLSFFARACCEAARDVPVVNARIDGTDIIYNRSMHLGIAVATERGLVVPVVRRADQMTFAEIEADIARLAGLARTNKLGIDDLSGGTFSITNGGVFGSLLSTPILNPPQSAILGMHKIEKRAVVVDDQIVIRPMMYVALSYDHRIIDGEQAVTFLVRVKERLEDPTRLLLGC